MSNHEVLPSDPTTDASPDPITGEAALASESESTESTESTEGAPSPPSGFACLPLDPRLLAAVARLGYTEPTPIQAQAIPPLLEGRDMIGRARTGTGKTAAFALPLLHKVRDGGRRVRALVLTPTRELALQVTRSIEDYGRDLGVRVVTLYGGAPYRKQFDALAAGVTVVVGTPGRILDHLDRGSLDLGSVEIAVLDEADEMLRMGFVADVETILATLPTDRQTALFSATMPLPIRKVAATHLRDPVRIEIETQARSADHVEQRFIRVPDRFKLDALLRILRGEPGPSTLVFVRTRRACAEVAEALSAVGISVDALHGDLDQQARERVMTRLRDGRVEVVVATDVAARGLDVAHLARVVNYDLPDDVDTYVHRVGRTSRAGATGCAVSFVSPVEGRKVHALESALRQRFEPSTVPTDAAIARLQRDGLTAELLACLDGADLADAQALVEELCGSSGRSPIEVAAAALVRLAKARSVPLRIPEEVAPSWTKPRARMPDRDRPHPAAPRGGPRPSGPLGDDHVDLFVPMGRQHGLRKSDLVGALTKGLGLDGGDVGQIRLEDRKAFVGVPRAIADRWMREDVRIVVRGAPVAVRLAVGAPARGRPVAGDHGRGASVADWSDPAL